MTKLIKMNPERESAVTIAREMLLAGAGMAEIRVRVNRECPGLDAGTKRWTLSEVERERGSLFGSVHSKKETTDSPGAREDA